MVYSIAPNVADKIRKIKRYCFTCFRVCSRRESSASFINRQRGTDKPCAMECATVMLGLRSPRSMREIIFEDKLAFSANSSCENFLSFRCRRTTSEKKLAKFSGSISPICQPTEQ